MLKDWLNRFYSTDERFIMHRYHSTRWAVIVGAVMMSGWVIYEYFFRQTLRLDLVIILLSMAITKLVMMTYLQLTH